MIRSYLALAMLAVCGAAAALAQEPGQPTIAPGVTDKPAPMPPADLQRKLADAQARLDAAAREIAELSMRQGGEGPAMRSFAFRNEGGARRAILGVQLGRGGGDDAKSGAKVVTVSPGGPAAAAGLKAGDIIVGIDSMDLRGRDNAERDLVQQMRNVAPDQKVKLKVERDGKVRDFVVTARAAPAPMVVGGSRTMTPGLRVGEPGTFMAGPGIRHDFDMENLPDVIGTMFGARSFPGLELSTLTPKLGQYFGVDKGVLVLKAPDANKLKLQEGDVIVSIDGRAPATASHALRILRSYQPGEKIKLRVQRSAMTWPDMFFEAPAAPPPLPPAPDAHSPRIEKRIIVRTGDEERT
jgi:hypothetical protein